MDIKLSNLPRVLRCWRHHEELTTREAAKMLGIDHATLWRFEQGEAVNQATLVTIWRWLLG